MVPETTVNNRCFIRFAGKEVHIRDLWLEIFRRGMEAHESWKDKDDAGLQVLFDYWIKEKLGID